MFLGLIFSLSFALADDRSTVGSSNPVQGDRCFPEIKFISGSRLRESSPIAKAEKGDTVKVPCRGDLKCDFDLYYHTPFGFDPKKKSLIVFSGGPGSSSHSAPDELQKTYGWAKDLGLNLILFDQRGIAFSRPQSRAIYANPKFYSSEYTVQDAAAVLDKLQVKEAIIYGPSYGTVPATMFAHEFPQRTSAVILEGIHDGKTSVNENADALTKSVRLLSPHAKQVLKAYVQSDSAKIEISGMFPILLKAMVQGYGRRGIQDFEKRLGLQGNPTSSQLENAVLHFGDSMRDPRESTGLDNDSLVNNFLSTKELGLFPEIPVSMTFDADFNLKAGGLNFYRSEALNCGIDEKSVHNFDAKNFPVKDKMLYIEGDLDPNTPMPGALRHFKEVAPKGSIFLSVSDAGHNPISNFMNCDVGPCPSLEIQAARRKQFVELIRAFLSDGGVVNTDRLNSELRKKP